MLQLLLRGFLPLNIASNFWVARELLPSRPNGGEHKIDIMLIKFACEQEHWDNNELFKAKQ